MNDREMKDCYNKRVTLSPEFIKALRDATMPLRDRARQRTMRRARQRRAARRMR